MQLEQLQNAFQAYLRGKDAAVLSEIVASDASDAAQRMDVYEAAYHFRLIDTLSDNFTGLHYLLGDEQFYLLARQYIIQRPSPHRNIRWFGHELVDYLKGTEPWSTNPMIVDVAVADWAALNAFDAADAEVLDESVMATVDPANWPLLTMSFHASVQLVDLRCNAFEFRAAAMQELPDTQAPVMSDEPAAWLVWRKDIKQHFRSIEVDEHWAIVNAINGSSFAELCEGLCEWIDEEHAPMRAVTFLKQWFADGLIIGIEVSE